MNAGLQLPHDFVTPPPAPLWPLAPGIWILLIAGLTLLLGLAFLFWRRRQARRPLRRAEAKLVLTVCAWRHDPRALAHRLSALLHEFAGHYQPETQPLTGGRWLAFLDQVWLDQAWPEGRRFSEGDGKVLAHFAAESPTFDPDRLQALCAEWLQRYFHAQLALAKTGRGARYEASGARHV